MCDCDRTVSLWNPLPAGEGTGTPSLRRACGVLSRGRGTARGESHEQLSFCGCHIRSEPIQDPSRLLCLLAKQEMLGHIELLSLTDLLPDHGQDTLFFLFQVIVLGNA